MEELKQDVKSIKADVQEIKVHLAVNTQSLKEHMRRTEVSEKRLSTVEWWILTILSGILFAAIQLIKR